MATAVAYKNDFSVQADSPLPQEEVARAIDYSIRQDNVGLLRATSQSQVRDLIAAGQSGSFDQGVDPQIYRASSGLIQRDSAGFPVNIEAYGYPYDVLENVAAQLEAMGASQYATAQVMGALKDYIINMGSEFSRAAKAKPLYVRIMVTDREPDDLPECEQTQAVFLDGVRKIGGEAARINVQSTVFGTKSTTSQGVDIGAMFASKTKGLFVFFGSPTNEGIGGFDTVDAALVNLAQGMGGGAGGGATQQAIDEIKQAIKNGEATPQTLKLIENLAALAQLADGMKTPGAVANAPAQMTEIVRAITQQIQSGVAEGTIPAAVLQGTATVIANMQNNDLVQAILASPDGAKSLVVAADNDNAAPAVKPDNDNATIAKQIEAITAQLTELAAVPTTPPELRAQIEAQLAQITKATDAPQGAEVQAVLASVAQTLSGIDIPAAAAIVAQIDVAAAQINAAQTAEAPAAAAAAPPQLPDIADPAAADIKELIAALQKADALPPALAEAVQKTDLQNMTPEKLADALQGKGESAPAVQAVIAALADPAVQAQLPAETPSAVNTFMTRQPEAISAVATQAAVQAPDAAAATFTPESAAPRSVADAAPIDWGVSTPSPVPQPAQPPVDFKLPDIAPASTDVKKSDPIITEHKQPNPVTPPAEPPVNIGPRPVNDPPVMPPPNQPPNPPADVGPKPPPPAEPSKGIGPKPDPQLVNPPRPTPVSGPPVKPPVDLKRPDVKPEQPAQPKDNQKNPAKNEGEPRQPEEHPKPREPEDQYQPPREEIKTPPNNLNPYEDRVAPSPIPEYKSPEIIVPMVDPRIAGGSSPEAIIEIPSNGSDEPSSEGGGCGGCKGGKQCGTCGKIFNEAAVAKSNAEKAAAIRKSGVSVDFSSFTPS